LPFCARASETFGNNPISLVLQFRHGTELFPALMGIIVALLCAQLCEVTRIDIAHLCEELPLEIGCGGVLDHAIALLIEPFCLLGLTHLLSDFCLDSQIAWNEVKLTGNFGVPINSALSPQARPARVPLCWYASARSPAASVTPR
jgi:hypothetical protein